MGNDFVAAIFELGQQDVDIVGASGGFWYFAVLTMSE